jgi:ribosomal protein S7
MENSDFSSMYPAVHRGPYIQQGRGFGQIFATLFRYLKPVVSKGIGALFRGGKRALADRDVRDALRSVKKSSLKGGVKAYERLVNPKNQAKNVRTAKKRVLTAANIKKKKQRTIFD